MTECTNIDLQDKLPDLLAGNLLGSDQVEVELHLASCAACHAEYALLEAVHRVRPEPPELNIAAIVVALPAPPAAADTESPTTAGAERPLRLVPHEHGPRRPMSAPSASKGRRTRSFASSNVLRFAAALTVVAVGSLSLAVANRSPQSLAEVDGQALVIGSDTPLVVADVPGLASPYAPEATLVQPVVSVAPAVLPLQELSDYSHEELTLLLERLDEWDGAPRADSSGVSALQIDGANREGL